MYTTIVLGVGIAIGMYIASQIESKIDKRIKHNRSLNLKDKSLKTKKKS